MEFKHYPLHDAIGVLTCSKISLGKNNYIPSGKTLDASDISSLRRAGYSHISGAKISSSEDIIKSTAITKLASAIAGDNTAYQIDENFRCFIYAEKNGIADINAERVTRFNSTGQEVVLSTIQPFSQVSRGQMLAAVSIIPPAIDENNLQNYLKTTFGNGAIIGVSPYRSKKVCLIQSFMPKNGEDYQEDILLNMTARIASLGAEVGTQIKCDHTLEEIGRAVSKAIASENEVIIISGAATNYHKDDIIVQALLEASADIKSYFIPNYPGENMIIADYKQSKQIVVLPEGCDSTNYNSIDLILRKIIADYDIDNKQILQLGAGGLLTKEAWNPINLDDIPNLIKVTSDDSGSQIAAVIIAAGKATRMGGNNKLFYEIDDKTVISMAVDAALASNASPVVVVTGFENDLISKELKDKDVILVHNSDYGSGVFTSIKTGLESLNSSIKGAVIIPADMPFVTPEHINRLIDAFDPVNKKSLCISTYKKVRANPILWARKLFESARIVPENAALHPTLVEHSDYICEIPFLNDKEAVDINTPSDIDALKK